MIKMTIFFFKCIVCRETRNLNLNRERGGSVVECFIPKFMINLTTLILKLSISHFLMVMFLILHPMESISVNSFVLLEHLAMLLTSTLAINS